MASKRVIIGSSCFPKIFSSIFLSLNQICFRTWLRNLPKWNAKHEDQNRNQHGQFRGLPKKIKVLWLSLVRYFGFCLDINSRYKKSWRVLIVFLLPKTLLFGILRRMFAQIFFNAFPPPTFFTTIRYYYYRKQNFIPPPKLKKHLKKWPFFFPKPYFSRPKLFFCKKSFWSWKIAFWEKKRPFFLVFFQFGGRGQ